jgi:isopenicillin-N epimerase
MTACHVLAAVNVLHARILLGLYLRLDTSWLPLLQGAALLWVHPSKQDSVHPLATSHGYGCGFRTEFLWQGTNDMTAWLAVDACISVLQLLQPEEVSRYNHNLVKDGTKLLQQAWGTELALGIAEDGSTAGMVAVQIPWPLALVSTSSDENSSNPRQDGPAAAVVQVNRGHTAGQREHQAGQSAEQLSVPTAEAAVALNKLLRNKYKIEVPVACVAGMLWCRISAQIYNSLQDYQRLADVVQQLTLQADDAAASAS